MALIRYPSTYPAPFPVILQRHLIVVGNAFLSLRSPHCYDLFGPSGILAAETHMEA